MQKVLIPGQRNVELMQASKDIRESYACQRRIFKMLLTYHSSSTLAASKTNYIIFRNVENIQNKIKFKEQNFVKEKMRESFFEQYSRTFYFSTREYSKLINYLTDMC